MKVYIVEAKRSAIGKFCGSLKDMTPGDLAGQIMKNVLENINKEDIDEVILGNVLSAGQGQGVARQAALHAGIPVSVPAYSVNMICGSGMKSIMMAYAQIKAGLAHLIVAGGVEVMSQAPFVTANNVRLGHKMGNMNLKDTLIHDGLLDAIKGYHMGITAENIADTYDIGKEKQDIFAIESQVKAIKAIDEDKFYDEIIPIEVKFKNKTTIFSRDEYPNRETTLEKLKNLKPAFKENGTVTAGNASGLNDGGSILVLASQEIVEKYQLVPLVEVIGIGQGGVEPEIMGMGPVPAIKNALLASHMDLKDIDLLELNEAFAAQSLGVIEELKNEYKDLDDNWFKRRTNVNGGAIALGHPLGASGARITTTLIHEMKKRKVKHGLASLCVGGGMGTCLILRRVESEG